MKTEECIFGHSQVLHVLFVLPVGVQMSDEEKGAQKLAFLNAGSSGGCPEATTTPKVTDPLQHFLLN